MKSLHRPDLYCWSIFDEARNVDFHSICWVRPNGNVLIDPLPLSPHDLGHLADLGGADHVVVTNSDHTRAAETMKALWGSTIYGPRAEAGAFHADRWLCDGEEIVPGLVALELHGSKTPGELALLLHDTTLITGDLIRAHRAGSLMMLPDAKLQDRDLAIASVRRLASLPGIDTVLVGDGWQVFGRGAQALAELAAHAERVSP